MLRVRPPELLLVPGELSPRAVGGIVVRVRVAGPLDHQHPVVGALVAVFRRAPVCDAGEHGLLLPELEIEVGLRHGRLRRVGGHAIDQARGLVSPATALPSAVRPLMIAPVIPPDGAAGAGAAAPGAAGAAVAGAAAVGAICAWCATTYAERTFHASLYWLSTRNSAFVRTSRNPPPVVI